MTSLNLQKTESGTPVGLTVNYNEPGWKILVGKGRCNWARLRTVSGKAKGSIVFALAMGLLLLAYVSTLTVTAAVSSGYASMASSPPSGVDFQAYRALAGVTSDPVARYQSAKDLFPADLAPQAINAHIQSLQSTGQLSPDVSSEQVTLSKLQSDYWTSAETEGYDRVLYVPAGDRGYLIGAVVNNNDRPVFFYGALVKGENWQFFNLKTNNLSQFMVPGFGVAAPVEVPYFATAITNSSN